MKAVYIRNTRRVLSIFRSKLKVFTKVEKQIKKN